MRRRRRYGQHFLVSKAVASRVVGAADIRGGDTVLEVGTG
ncbi:MAG: ribose ABC transporter permease, partial [Nitrosopumilaceae archaeon]|nr:ribose ABC transporter permease [Nitrosopumilaceae archaeon]